MLLLFETASGYALFKVKEGKATEIDALQAISEASQAKKILDLSAFKKFEDTTQALDACTALVESKLCKPLQKFLSANIVSKEIKDQLLVADAKLGNLIKEKLGIQCLYNEKLNQELARVIRAHMTDLIAGLSPQDINHMSLGLAHSFSRYKLKFSPDKVDTMIVQAVALLDDLDKEVNTYAMRVREWFGWHFPELSKIITDNIVYCKIILAVGTRPGFAKADLSELIPEELVHEVKELAPVSMGTEISEEDVSNIKELCSQVVEISEYREQLWDYLKNRMQAIAPNLTALVGELVGARLIAHTGSLLNLAKYPASTIQILGAEKALFRALKAKKKTPKYGLIYHASLIGQTPPKNKGQISRVLAAKAALCARVDALGDATEVSIGFEGRTKVENRLRLIEGKAIPKAGGPGSAVKPAVYAGAAKPAFNAASDVTTPVADKKKKKTVEVEEEAPVAEVTSEKKKKKKTVEVEEEAPVAEVTSEKKKKKKTVEAEVEATPGKKRSRDAEPVEKVAEVVSEKKKKKKEKKAESDDE